MVHQGTGAIPTDMAQRQRAGLITPRTQDRNLLSVSFFNSPKLISPYPTHFPVSHSFPVTAAPPPHFFSSTIYSGLFNACLPANADHTLCIAPLVREGGRGPGEEVPGSRGGGGAGEP